MQALLSILFLAAAALHAQGAVEGKVVSATDASPVRKATVLLRAAGAADGQPGRGSYLTQTDSNGRFSIDGLAPGTYDCVASRAGFAARAPNQSAAKPPYLSVTVENGARIADVILRLTPLGVITGRVLDAEGYPVSSANVMAMQYGYQQGKKVLLANRSAQSDDHGEYRIFDLFPGTYYVRSNGGRFMQASPRSALTYYPGTLAAAQAAPVEVTAAGEARSIDIRLQPLRAFAIRGKLPGAGAASSARSFNSFSVRPRPMDPGFPGAYSVSTRNNSTWEISGLAPGSYVVRMTGTDPATNAAQVAQAFVDIVNSDVDGVELSFAPASGISGSVKLAGTAAAALDSLRVTLLPNDEGPQLESRVKADGTFSIPNVFPGAYRIGVEPVESVYPKSIRMGDRELPDRQLDVTGGGSLTIVVAADFGKVQGIVTDAAGNPAASQTVTLIPDQSKSDWLSWYRNAVTDARGRFTMGRVAPGRYTVFAWQDAPPGAPLNAEFRKPFEQLGQEIVVEPASAQTLELRSIE
jgi:hypothetical protein